MDDRREFLRRVGASALGLTFGPVPFEILGCGSGGANGPPGVTDGPGNSLDLSFTAVPTEVQIRAGAPTSVLTYQVTASSGPGGGVIPIAGAYLGPVIRVRRGDRFRARLSNGVGEPTNVHWHGLLVPAAMDGHPTDTVEPGGALTYEFPVRNRAGTYWFHPHPEGRTATQVYRGLAGLFLVGDDEEDASELPSDDLDVPLVIQDRTFDGRNALWYSDGGMMGIGPGSGFLGDTFVVNGTSSFVLSVARRVYRLRILNGCNARVLKLGWHDLTSLQAIGSDGGLLAAPVERDYLMLAPGERVDLWADFSDRSVGDELVLETRGYLGGSGGMGMGMPGMGSGPANGTELPILRVRVDRDEREPRALPERLSEIERLHPEDAVNANNPRTFRISLAGMMQWVLNGHSFEPTAVAANESVRLGSQETWVFENDTSPMAMMHPIHVHGVQFQVVSRSTSPFYAVEWESVRHGYLDEGWKDTVLVMPGERVQVVMRFTDYDGLFLYHCHNLEHEDQGMMRNYRIDR